MGKPLTLAWGGDDVGVVAESLEEREGLVCEEPSPVLKRCWDATARGAFLVGGGDRAK